MSDSCDTCGYRNAELKGAGGIPAKGRRIKLQVETPEDLLRDVIKAESASVEIPQLDLYVSTGSSGGLVTTVEGLLSSVSEVTAATFSVIFPPCLFSLSFPSHVSLPFSTPR